MFIFRIFRAFRLSALKNKNFVTFAPSCAIKMLRTNAQRVLSTSRINIEIELQYFFNAESAEGRKELKFFNVRFPRIPRFPSFRVFRLSALINKNSALFVSPHAKKYCCARRRGERRGIYPPLESTLKSNLQYFFNAESAEGRKERKFFNVHFPRIPRFPSFRVKK
jgi:hypothetical protein